MTCCKDCEFFSRIRDTEYGFCEIDFYDVELHSLLAVDELVRHGEDPCDDEDDFSPSAAYTRHLMELYSSEQQTRLDAAREEARRASCANPMELKTRWTLSALAI